MACRTLIVVSDDFSHELLFRSSPTTTLYKWRHPQADWKANHISNLFRMGLKKDEQLKKKDSFIEMPNLCHYSFTQWILFSQYICRYPSLWLFVKFCCPLLPRQPHYAKSITEYKENILVSLCVQPCGHVSVGLCLPGFLLLNKNTQCVSILLSPWGVSAHSYSMITVGLQIRL